jgi:hypothetical protein
MRVTRLSKDVLVDAVFVGMILVSAGGLVYALLN